MENGELRMNTAKWKLFLILYGSLCLCACGTKKEYISTTRLIETKTPEYLLEPTPSPVLEGPTNAHLLQLILDYKEALLKCNADKEAVRGL